MRILPGKPYPQGATWDGQGVNFALFSQHAHQVDLCLFEGPDTAIEARTVRLTERHNGVWHAYLPEVRPGQLYGYRVHGPYAPKQGHRFNPHKLLLDPYAKALTGPVTFRDELLAYRVGSPRGDLSYDTRDSAPYVPKCVVIDDSFDWQGIAPPRIPWDETVIYEAHVKGMTMRHPSVPYELRGSYLGLVSPPVLDYLVQLGITAVELLPLHQSVSEPFLQARDLTNYWGYSTIGYFAPDVRFASEPGAQAVNEFKTMVRELHRAGIEVILDVVYNHSAEGGAGGPTLCFRGIDNRTYYRLAPEAKEGYRDYTGCGNSLDLTHPRVLQMVCDSLRYWVQQMHVDGFRFDLATTLAREPEAFERCARLFAVLQQDPTLAPVKLIAEPWDLGPGGYQLGNFPDDWGEWNDKFRDTVRRFWRGDAGQAADLAYRLSGSSDVFVGRTPHSSINFVTAHDGFTLHDLVSYARKHNEKNGEANNDGAGESWSSNWGVEGPTDDPSILKVREQTKKNFLATLLLAQGVPMIAAGDEIGRTQGGNNNAYCQDNETSWLDWQMHGAGAALLELVRTLTRIRKENPVLRKATFFRGTPPAAHAEKDVQWLDPHGRELTHEAWHDTTLRAFSMLVDARSSDLKGAAGEPQAGTTVMICLNAEGRPRTFHLPQEPKGGRWREQLYTAGPARGTITGKTHPVAARALCLLRFDLNP